MAKRFTLREGDIFTIPINDGVLGLGQILWMPKHKHEFIMVVFDKKFKDKDEIVLTEISKWELVFLGYTVDAKLYNKKWEIIDNMTSNLSNVKKPFFKLGLATDHPRMVDFKGDVVVDPISIEHFNKLAYQTQVAPVRFENALKAYYRFETWKDDDYNLILYSNAINSVAIASEILNN